MLKQLLYPLNSDVVINIVTGMNKNDFAMLLPRMLDGCGLIYEDTEERAGEFRLRSSNRSASLRRAAALKSTTFRYLVGGSIETNVGSVVGESDTLFLSGGGPRAIRRLRVEFQRFLMALSVRPGMRLAISAQRLPNSP